MSDTNQPQLEPENQNTALLARIATLEAKDSQSQARILAMEGQNTETQRQIELLKRQLENLATGGLR
jgi:uncharacterized coiled-coil protein SlyX